MPDGSQNLIVGADNFPFPIPLKKNNDGRWFFDTAAGKEEVLNRRVGRNELAVIQACGAVADAQARVLLRETRGREAVRAEVHQRSGQQNGLYWPEVQGQPRSPLGPLAANATAEGYKADPTHHQPFHGYYFVDARQAGSGSEWRREGLYRQREDDGRVRGRGVSGEVRRFRAS